MEGTVEETEVNRHEVLIGVGLHDEYETLLLKDTEIVKIFTVGMHVKVITGTYMGKTGTVVMIDENGLNSHAIVLSDIDNKEMSVPVNYLVESNERDQGLVSVEGFELYDLVTVSR